MAKNKWIKTRSQIDPVKLKAANEKFTPEVVDATLKNRGITNPSNDNGTGSTPTPINTPSITPVWDPWFVDTTDKWAEGTTTSAANPEGKITVDPVLWEAPKDVITQQQEAIEATKKTALWLEWEATNRTIEDKKVLDEKKKEEEAFASEQEALIKEKENELASVQLEIDRKAEESKQAEIDLLKVEQADALLLSKQTAALQQQKDDDAIKEAEAQIELDKQRAAIAFNKLWLSFSSGIILQSQQISDNASLKIATLKVQASFNETKAAVDLNKLQLEFARDVNSTIDKYTTIQLNNKKEIAARINETKTNLLLTNKQKEDAISSLEDKYFQDKRKTEDDLKKEQERLSDRALAQTRQLEADFLNVQNVWKGRINDLLTNWAIYNMSDVEKKALADKAWISMNELNGVQQNAISSEIIKSWALIMWEDYIISWTDRAKILDKTNSLLKAGKTLQDASQIAAKEVLSQTEDFKKQQELSALSVKEKEAKLKSSIAKYYSTWATSTTWYKFKWSDMVKTIWEEWQIFFTNRVNGDTIEATQDGTQVITVGQWPSTFLNPTWEIKATVRTKVPVKARVTWKWTTDEPSLLEQFLAE